MRHAWIDASAGIAGDMLLGALLDAGADEQAVRAAITAVAGDAVRLHLREVRRAGLRALKVDIELADPDPPERRWREIRDLLARAGAEPAATDVFRRLAEAEARVHGITPDEVHFHEVGALDAIADVVGCCAALADLGVRTVSAGPVALGSGTVRARHGRLPVPAPAVA
ncbi:LarC family nickel insertion protein, partial [Actinoplanes sp. KI2]|uniref:LarC family nickel insertion protein n=1 Tax=Actinoplanes sp. KI2 TaxID=2983315 RepID=UPI0021D5DBAB